MIVTGDEIKDKYLETIKSVYRTTWATNNPVILWFLVSVLV